MTPSQPHDPRVWMPNDLMMVGVGPRPTGAASFYVLEVDGTSRYQLEDGTGSYQIE